MSARSVLKLGAVVLALGHGGCSTIERSEPAAERFAAELRAHTPNARPVAGVRAWADGRALGTTSERGVLAMALEGREGRPVELTIACPAAYRTDPPSRKLVLRRVRDGSGRPPLRLDALCIPLETSAALVVLASGPSPGGLPVRMQGEVIGQTGDDGSAHLLVTGRTGATQQVQIDTSARPALQPRSPVHTVRLEDEESILLVEQRFTLPPRARPRPRTLPPHPPAPPQRRPQRID